MTKEKPLTVRFETIFSELDALPLQQKVMAINEIRTMLHECSPFKREPIDLVLWVPFDTVAGNDYNPNTVAPPEMKLLETSIQEDGYTQPIVSFKNGDAFEVVDGFHRNRVGKESPIISERIQGYLPVTVINSGRGDRGDRIAATIRHNRARGKHQVQRMSEIVVELKRRNWSDSKIAQNLGMDEDEILRLCQVTGMRELFADADFSKSWDIGFEESLDEIKDENIFEENEA